MNIIVCIKAVPSTNTVKLDPVTHTIVRDGKQAVVNPFDLAALEEALCIREQLGGTVTVLSMGIPDTARLTDDLLCRGADRAVLLSDRAFAGADTLATSYALSCAMKKMGGADLILCGKMAVDGDTAQIGPELAGALGCTFATDILKIEKVTEREVTAIRNTDRGRMRVAVMLPAVLTVAKDIRIPRMPSIASLRAHRGAETLVWNAAEAEADPTRTGLSGSPTQVVSTYVPDRGRQTVEYSGGIRQQAEALVRLLSGSEAPDGSGKEMRA